MKPSFNPNCLYCPRATECHKNAAKAIGRVAGENKGIEISEEILKYRQLAYQDLKNLEATGLPGEFDQERALVKEVIGIDFPVAQDLFSERKKIKEMQVLAGQLQQNAEDAVRTNDDLMNQCPGPKAVKFANFYVAVCRGNGLSFLKGIFISKTRPERTDYSE